MTNQNETPENAWGRTTLATILVDVTYSPSRKVTVEFQIEPNIICVGDRDMLPGITYNPEYYGASQFEDNEDVGETIAYLINEGRIVADSIERTDDDDGGAGSIQWAVQADSLATLRQYGLAN